MLTTREAVGIVARELKDEVAVCTTGFTCRDVQHWGDRPGNFYMIGSMGMAASMGLGIAISKPKSRVAVFDGDGSVLMGLGVLAMIGSLKPGNLVHIVFDNEAYASTGGQATYSSSVPLDRLAQEAGYKTVRRAGSAEELRTQWGRLRAAQGPVFLLVKCRPDLGPPAERVRLGPEELTTRMAHYLNER
ncbi:MAG: sulfopyruvate decarboxylase subunit beta [Candidatus Omnitrophica bacterium]|nr:sulfopyruvate decarboxylase subunit beta [Candidatus Omnitrophota bacterium]